MKECGWTLQEVLNHTRQQLSFIARGLMKWKDTEIRMQAAMHGIKVKESPLLASQSRVQETSVQDIMSIADQFSGICSVKITRKSAENDKVDNQDA